MSHLESSASPAKDSVVSKGQAVVDAVFPPEKRAQWWIRFKTFAIQNPKLTGFLLTNVALSGAPLLLFIVFTITVFVFSLVAALLIALVAALLFTVFMLLVALFIVLPTVFMTTMAATFIFLWVLGGFYIFKWFNAIEGPGEKGEALGDQMNGILGGRLTWLMDAARKTPSEGDESEKLLSTSGNGLSTSRVSSPARPPATPTRIKNASKPQSSTPGALG